MEFKRIFFNSKLILLTLAALMLSCIVFVMEQTEDYQENDVTFFAVSERISQLCEEYKKMSIDEAYKLNQSRIKENEFFSIMNICFDEANELYDFYKEMQTQQEQSNPELAEFFYSNMERLSSEFCLIQTYALKNLDTQLEYALNYNDKFERIEDNLNKLSQSSVMQTKYALTDGEKTYNDYNRIKDIELVFDDYRGIVAVFSFKLPIILSLILTAAVLFMFLQEGSNGLREIVRSTKNGRTVLEIKRIGILLLASVIYPLILYSTLILVSASIYGGLGTLSANVQSVDFFEDITYPVTFGMFAFINLFVIILGIFVFVLFLRSVIALIRPIRMALLFTISTTIVQWTLYSYIADQNIFSVFKYAN